MHCYDWKTPDLSPLYPELARLFFVSDQSIAVYFLSLSFFCVIMTRIMTRILRLRFFSRSRKLPRCHALREPLSPSPLMTPWPGRNSRSGVRASLNTFCSFSLCSVQVVRASQTDSSPFLRPFSQTGVELALLHEVYVDLSDVFIPSVLGIHDKSTKDYILRSLSDPCYSHRA